MTATTSGKRSKVEKRLVEVLPLVQQERDEETPDPPVAVHERVDRLELVVDERELDQERRRGRA